MLFNRDWTWLQFRVRRSFFKASSLPSLSAIGLWNASAYDAFAMPPPIGCANLETFNGTSSSYQPPFKHKQDKIRHTYSNNLIDEGAPVGHFPWNSLHIIIIMCTVDGQIRFPVLSYIQCQRMLCLSDHHQPTKASIAGVPNSGRRSGNVEYFGHINFFRNVGRPRRKNLGTFTLTH